MSKGSLQQRHGTWYVVVGYKDEFGKPKQKYNIMQMNFLQNINHLKDTENKSRVAKGEWEGGIN